MADGEASDDLELSDRTDIDSRRKAIAATVPTWTDTSRIHPAQPPIEVLTETSEVSNAILHYASGCRMQLLAITPDHRCARIDPRIRMATLYSSGRGIDTRALYEHRGLRDRRGRASLTELVDTGAAVRVTSTVPGASVVIDREVALLPVLTPDASALVGLAIIHDAAVVAWITATFERLWTDASPVAELLGRRSNSDETEHTRVAILRLLAEGEKDEAISRRLSVSVRTCRRHIAEYMAQVGASSRFQAGVIAARSGHLDAAGIG